MKSSKVMKVFEQYVKKYDLNNSNIKMKYFHSLKTMELARDLATTLGIFDEEEIAVCELIGLFHEIGSFDSTPNYKMMNSISEDYTEKTLDILFKQGVLRKITDDTKYDDIIKLAIFAYNKSDMPTKVDEKTLHFCAVLRDVHRIDTFRLIIDYPFMDVRIDEYPSDMVYNDFKLFRVISEKLGENNADEVLIVLSNTFDLKYKYSYYLLKNNNYVNKTIASLNFGSKEVENFFKQLAKVLNSYIERKIGG